MYMISNVTSLLLYTSRFTYTSGVVGLTFTYTTDLVNTGVYMYFMPKYIGVEETKKVPLYPVMFDIQ